MFEALLSDEADPYSEINFTKSLGKIEVVYENKKKKFRYYVQRL